MKAEENYPDEGYIKFNLIWKKTHPFSKDILSALIKHRDTLFQKGLIGFDEQQKVGFGNISERIKGTGTFYISATQTGHIPVTDAGHYSKVTNANPQGNELHCEGPLKASSESMTHAAIYLAIPECNAVIHVHHPATWAMNHLPFTEKHIPYGTPEMAEAVMQLAKVMRSRNEHVLVMKGHRDGIIAFGKTLEEATEALLMETEKSASL